MILYRLPVKDFRTGPVKEYEWYRSQIAAIRVIRKRRMEWRQDHAGRPPVDEADIESFSFQSKNKDAIVDFMNQHGSQP